MAELLSPAGNWDCVRAAVENGADAVYFGLEVGFNARARAVNFGLEELPRILDFLHARGAKGYVTLNTLVFSHELEQAERLLRCLIEAGVDALLIQDLGLAQLIRTLSADLVLHASTQMTLTSAPCLAKAAELGISRVVLPRELSLREIARVHRETHLELEAFVHGALCVAYSGQCLTSESLGGRSANRGQCAQACRLPYRVVRDGQEVDLGDQHYLLSPQDLAGYDLVPELLQAGVISLKIEGRLKTPEYVANITRHYRRALDAALEGKRAHFREQDVQEMEMSFSRGFSPGWLQGCNHKQLVPAWSSAKRGVRLGTVVSIQDEWIEVQLEAPLRCGDGIGFDMPRNDRQQQGSRVYEILRNQQPVSDAPPGATVKIACAHGALDWRYIAQGQIVWKTDDPQLAKQLRKTYTSRDPIRKVPLDVSIQAHVGRHLIITAQTATGVQVDLEGDEPLQPAQKHPISLEMCREQLSRLGHTHFVLRDLHLEQTGQPLVPLSQFGQLRRKMVDQLTATIPSPRWSLTAIDHGLNALRRQVAKREQAVPQRTSRLHVLCRTLRQLGAVVEQGGVDRVYADFHDIREYRLAVQHARENQTEIYLATPRIQKPDEMGIFRVLARHGADGILVRNLAGLDYFAASKTPMAADFSLNAANELTVHLLRRWGAQEVTPSYDLNRDQLLQLIEQVSTDSLELVIHQHMPMFHMEHCVFCAVLSPGTNKTNCGRPCDRHQVELTDRVGMQHPLQADVGCRNTLFNAQAQSAAEIVSQLQSAGVERFRVELLLESPEAALTTVSLYGRLLRREIRAVEVLQHLNAFNRVGVTRGTLEAERNPLALL